MRIRPAPAAPRTRPARVLPRGLCRGVAAVMAVLLLAPVPGCERPLVPPGAPTPWPAELARRWQWQWQLTGPLDVTADADVFLLDPVRTTSAETAALRARDRRLVCQVSVGTYAPSDPDASRFPADLRGGPVTGRPDHRWLDVRRWDTLKPVLADRLRLCRGKGFGAVALDDADGYLHRPGFPLDFDDQLLFNRRLAALARQLDLSPGLVGDVPQVAALAPDFDFAVNQECVRRRECAKLLPFADAHKPVFHVEYTGDPATFCVTTVGYGFASMRKDRALDAWREPCPLP
ncbi:endo alpha-1,4 polygalactosaminidase [Micromonospora sp. DR5-3]|uniref:endo alpha-1,4 polygalactosaminidase n=1 Tax=unclassified Micromonospora TaxID=2617518 RepID=UPI0011D6B7B6|nr:MULTISPECIES: endo alpha-1,4 polygalactosaminidase [unclassified Micromonospora]MCW3813566.1 endo alpha-1,4 polygalactosaminidase [Micromonospora sp. DR5-3]TYC24776.1 endo alpha-1,4 polygalactosaminidase [Micromonospora sp. MP36]